MNFRTFSVIIFSIMLLSLSFSVTSMMCILVYLMVFCKFLKICSLFFILFSFGFLDSIISNDLTSSVLSLYSGCLSLLLIFSIEFFNSIMLFFSSIISVQYFKKNCLYRFAEQLILFTHYFSEFFDLSVCIFLTLEFLENNCLNSFFWQLTGFHFFEVSHWKIIIFHSWCHGFAFSCFSQLCIYTCEFKGAVASFSLL